MANEQKLIDAEDFAKHIERMARTAYPDMRPGLTEAAEYAKDFLAVDAVKVVRCRECEHLRSRRNNFGVFFWCGNAAGLTNIYDPDKDYCPRGERRDKDAVD